MMSATIQKNKIMWQNKPNIHIPLSRIKCCWTPTDKRCGRKKQVLAQACRSLNRLYGGRKRPKQQVKGNSLLGILGCGTITNDDTPERFWMVFVWRRCLVFVLCRVAYGVRSERSRVFETGHERRSLVLGFLFILTKPRTDLGKKV